VNVPHFTHVAFRAGHLLFQPTQPVANILAQQGIRVDSSVYKGGQWREHGLDYRSALRNGYYWTFTSRSDVPHPHGIMLELPVYTQMVPACRLLTSKRLRLQGKGASGAQAGKKLLRRLPGLLRRQPLKLD